MDTFWFYRGVRTPIKNLKNEAENTNKTDDDNTQLRF